MTDRKFLVKVKLNKSAAEKAQDSSEHRYYGPFDDNEQAYHWAKLHIDVGGRSWRVVTLHGV